MSHQGAHAGAATVADCVPQFRGSSRNCACRWVVSGAGGGSCWRLAGSAQAPSRGSQAGLGALERPTGREAAEIGVQTQSWTGGTAEPPANRSQVRFSGFSRLPMRFTSLEIAQARRYCCSDQFAAPGTVGMTRIASSAVLALLALVAALSPASGCYFARSGAIKPSEAFTGEEAARCAMGVPVCQGACVLDGADGAALAPCAGAAHRAGALCPPPSPLGTCAGWGAGLVRLAGGRGAGLHCTPTNRV